MFNSEPYEVTGHCKVQVDTVSSVRYDAEIRRH